MGGGHGGGSGAGAEEEKRVDVTEEGKQLVRICSSQIKVEWAKTSLCDIVFNCDIIMASKLFEFFLFKDVTKNAGIYRLKSLSPS